VSGARFDVVVVGAGIIGLATARELQARRPDARIAVLDKERSWRRAQTRHSSGVVHRGSTTPVVKARFRVEAARPRPLRRAWDPDPAPEVVVATDDTEIPRSRSSTGARSRTACRTPS
jgi:L-2-hydroxyglutarate oxidase LhgO